MLFCWIELKLTKHPKRFYSTELISFNDNEWTTFGFFFRILFYLCISNAKKGNISLGCQLENYYLHQKCLAAKKGVNVGYFSHNSMSSYNNNNNNHWKNFLQLNCFNSIIKSFQNYICSYLLVLLFIYWMDIFS